MPPDQYWKLDVLTPTKKLRTSDLLASASVTEICINRSGSELTDTSIVQIAVLNLTGQEWQPKALTGIGKNLSSQYQFDLALAGSTVQGAHPI